MSVQNTATLSLFERIGGKAAVEGAVDLFYSKVMADELLIPFFEGVEMEKQRGKQKAFLSYAFGGMPSYPGKNLREGHQHLVERGMGDQHFDAVAGHLQATLVELGVPDDLVQAVMAIAGSTRDDILNR